MSSKPLQSLKNSLGPLRQIRRFFVVVTILLLFHWFIYTLDPGWLSWSVNALAMLVIFLTSLARLKDLQTMSWKGQMRRLGLILVGAAAFTMIIAPLALKGPELKVSAFPTWPMVMLSWGIAVTWITTPHMPPWWRYISGEYKKTNEISTWEKGEE